MGSKRRHIPGQKKLEIVLEGLQVDNVAEFCRKKDIAEVQFYNWKNKLEETKDTLVEVTKERELLKKKTSGVCRGSR